MCSSTSSTEPLSVGDVFSFNKINETIVNCNHKKNSEISRNWKKTECVIENLIGGCGKKHFNTKFIE
ncbi:hypothetical protein BpHYR1_036152 [Brachionus plicatilis]|uniref:Uncharacterized protein n=1 Tax=Brachionus plicatilis TaxID=10195 RepID=A0A3M7PFN5_BRAPC|nr:hypothetical protein BpHYR1_036152 [Brachionus plicatilis]